jgi:large subunit ribosomal protein L6
MSRVGKLPIALPPGVTVRIDRGVAHVQGPKGSLQERLPARVRVETAADTLRVVRDDDSREARSQHGLAQRLLANMVKGVHTGFSRTLEVVGVGYRCEVRPQGLYMSLGYSHPILFQLPPGVQAKVERQTVITLESIDRQLVGEIAATIRKLRPPEPYKGKGIKYAGEVIRRKAGKAAGAAGG